MSDGAIGEAYSFDTGFYQVLVLIDFALTWFFCG